jgi:hypothetical protein
MVCVAIGFHDGPAAAVRTGIKPGREGFSSKRDLLKFDEHGGGRPGQSAPSDRRGPDPDRDTRCSAQRKPLVSWQVERAHWGRGSRSSSGTPRARGRAQAIFWLKSPESSSAPMYGIPMSRSSGELQRCSEAGADQEAIPAWIETGRARRDAAKRPPNSDGLRSLMPFLRPLVVPQPIFVSDLEPSFCHP